MINRSISFVVEGHGEVSALPVLARRIFEELNPAIYVDVRNPIRSKKGTLVSNDAELERALRLAKQKADEFSDNGSVLVLVDADDDCPVQLASQLLGRARHVLASESIHVVVACSEFESWFLAGAESLCGVRGLPSELSSPDNPEGIRGAKEWLSRKMEGRGKYRPTIDQAPLAAKLDIVTAQARSRSFRKLYEELEKVIFR